MKLLFIRLILFVAFPVAYLSFTISGAFEALYTFLRETETFYEQQTEEY